MRRAMVVHGSWVIGEILKEDLITCGCEVSYQASSRLEAILMYRLHRPDIVLINATEIHTIDDILEIDPAASVIAVVGVNDDHIALKALVSGAEGLLVLPLTTDVLQYELDRTLKHRNKSEIMFKTFESKLIFRKIYQWYLNRKKTTKNT